jgi:glycosyltransferase involved in cell wall biosynthesis
LAAAAEPQSEADGRGAALPRITIITPCRNGRRFVAEAMDSVVRQNYPALEHLVLDARSTDGTLEILARYPHLSVVSESDAGSHQAMNKGIVRAGGDVIAFLNVDDIYPDQTLVTVGSIFAANPDVDIVVGRTMFFEGDRQPVLIQRGHADGKVAWLAEIAFGTAGFSGHFFRRRVFERIGNFDVSYHICADRHFLLRAALERPRYQWLDRLVLLYRVHAGSSTMNPQMANLMTIARENLAMAWEFVERTQAQPTVQRLFLDWHAFEGAKFLLRSALRGRFADAFATFVDLCRKNPLWLFRLPRARALNRMARRLFQPPAEQPS